MTRARIAFLLLSVALAGAECDPAALPAPAVVAAPGAPTDIQVRIVDRRATSMEVCWRAPAAEPGRQPARTFELRYARRPISAVDFDDPMITMRVHVAQRGDADVGGRPAFSPGGRVCQLVEHLYIENGYYFAVEAVGDEPPPRDHHTEPTS